MNTYIKLKDDGSDYLTHYGVKGMKWRKHKNYENRLDDPKERAKFDRMMFNAGYYINKDGNYQRDYEIHGSPIARKIQMNNGKIKLKAVSQNMLKSMRSKNNKRFKNKGKILILKLKTKRAAKKMAKRMKK